MPEVSCSRCGSTKPGLDRPPLPGSLGQRVVQRACASCWEEWKTEQVKLINELRLNVVDPEHYDQLIRAMTTFLSLPERGPE